MAVSKLAMAVNGNGFDLQGDLPTVDAMALQDRWLTAVEAQTDTATVLAAIQGLKETVMAQSAKFTEQLAKLDAATSEIAADLKVLREKAADKGMSDEDLAPLDSRIAQLEAMGKEPLPGDETPTDPTL